MSRGLAWVEITYSRPSSPGCQKIARNSLPGQATSGSREVNCISSFTFVGDLITLGHALHLTSYVPSWSINIGASLPNMLKKLFICAFHVSLSLALLNSLPVYFLDGECILEVILPYFSFLRQRMRRKVLQLVLVGGTFVSILPGRCFLLICRILTLYLSPILISLLEKSLICVAFILRIQRNMGNLAGSFLCFVECTHS